MPPSSKPVNVSRRIFFLALAVAVVVIAYTALWFFGAERAKSWLNAQLATQQWAGLQLECDNLDIKGYPFRVGIFCDTVAVKSPVPTSSGTIGAFRSAAQIYAPGHAVFELDGPVEIRPWSGIGANINWDLLHGSVSAGFNALKRASVETKALASSFETSYNNGAGQVSVNYGALHMRANGNDIDIAGNADMVDFRYTYIRPRIPVFSTVFDLTLDGMGDLAGGKMPPRSGDLTGTIRQFALDFGDQGYLSLSGPFSISPDGYLSGKFEVDVRDFDPLALWLKRILREDGEWVLASRQLVSDLSKDGKTAHITLTVRNGTILLGIIPLGFIPPI